MVGQEGPDGPAVDPDRQKFLLQLQGGQRPYPFWQVRLTRADVVWMLETNKEPGRSARARAGQTEPPLRGLDLRGADLRGVDLSSLRLGPVRLGLEYREWLAADTDQRELAAAHLEEASLRGSDLEGAEMNSAYLERCNLSETNLIGASVAEAHLDRANLSLARLDGALLIGARLVQASLIQASLRGADLYRCHMQRASLVKACLKGASLSDAHLEGGTLTEADLSGADLFRTSLQGATLTGARLAASNLLQANLRKANLFEAQLVGADAYQARLEGSKLVRAVLVNVSMREAHAEGVDLRGADLKGASLRHAHLEGANLTAVNAHRADFRGAYMEGSDLTGARLEGADLSGVHLEGASCRAAHLEGASLRAAQFAGRAVAPRDVRRIRDWVRQFPESLTPADLREVFLDPAANLDGIVLGNRITGYAEVADVRWGGVDLSVIDWASRAPRLGFRDQPFMLGDERVARQSTAASRASRLDRYRRAVRTNRQVANALRSQGLYEQADHFSYRAQAVQRVVLRKERAVGRWLLACLLDLSSGYGYRPIRSVAAYALIVLSFAAAYLAVGKATSVSLSPLESIVLSVTSFHGRGFFPGGIGLESPIVAAAALEAIFGLVIELSFIATFTQRFLGK